MAPDPIQPAVAGRQWRWAATIYAILALAAFAFPGGLREWLEERDSGGRLWLPIAIARQIEAASAAVGVKAVGENLRQRFAGWIGDGEP